MCLYYPAMKPSLVAATGFVWSLGSVFRSLLDVPHKSAQCRINTGVLPHTYTSTITDLGKFYFELARLLFFSDSAQIHSILEKT